MRIRYTIVHTRPMSKFISRFMPIIGADEEEETIEASLHLKLFCQFVYDKGRVSMLVGVKNVECI